MWRLLGVHPTPASYPNELGVLMSLGDMPSCKYPFMYAQEATRLSSLLETVCVELLITIVLSGDVSRLGLDIG